MKKKTFKFSLILCLMLSVKGTGQQMSNIFSQDVSFYGDVYPSKINKGKALTQYFILAKALLQNNLQSPTSSIKSLRTDYFLAININYTNFPTFDIKLILKGISETSSTLDTKYNSDTPRYSYKTYFFIGSNMTNAKYNIKRYVPADFWGQTLVEDNASLDLTANSASRDNILTLDPYFEGVLNTLTISGN